MKLVDLVCGPCPDGAYLWSPCNGLLVNSSLRFLFALILMFNIARGRDKNDKSVPARVSSWICAVEVAAAVLPVLYALSSPLDVPYVHVLDGIITLGVGLLVVDIYKNPPIRRFGLVSLVLLHLCLVMSLLLTAYAIQQHNYDASTYITILLICCAARVLLGITAFVVAITQLIDSIRSSGAAKYSSMSSSGARISLLHYSHMQENESSGGSSHLSADMNESESSSSTTSDEEDVPITYYDVLLFRWISPLIRLAASRPLEEEDVCSLPEPLQCNVNAEQLSAKWARSGSLIRSLLETYGLAYFSLGWLLLMVSILVFIGPIMLDNLVQCAEREASWDYVGLYISFLFLSKMAAAFCWSHYDYRCGKMSISISAGLKGALHRKVLRLSAYSRQKYTIGNLVNHYTVDVDRVMNVLIGLHFFWALPLQIIIALALLFWVVSYAMFAGLGAILVILGVNNIISKQIKSYTDKVMTSKDNRMRDVSEVFNSILTIKLNAWEAKFQEKIIASREEELTNLWKFLRACAFNVFLLWLAPSFVAVVVVVVYAKALHNDLSAGKIFTALALFRLLQEPLRSLPRYITMLFQAMTSIDRLQLLFNMEEKSSNYDAYNPAYSMSHDHTAILQRGSVVIRNAVFQWNRMEQVKGSTSKKPATTDKSQESDYSSSASSDSSAKAQFQLSIDNCVIFPTELVVVRGVVGSGKSSFCSALLGEMYGSPSTYVSMNGTVSYASQQAWIQSATVRDNILFGLPYDHEKYLRVVDACCLQRDFEEWPDYDQTVIGERGLNLSGGQKSRVSLARAVYSDGDIFIMDDIFAALDSVVGKQIFEKCVLTLLAGKTRVLVTHKEDIIYHHEVSKLVSFADGVFSMNVVNGRTGADSRADEFILSIMHVPYATPLLPTAIGAVDDDEDDGNEDMRTSILTDVESRNYSYGTPDIAKRMKSTNTTSEDRKVGSVGVEVYIQYLKAAGGYKVLLALVIIQVLWQLLSISADLYISRWTRENDEEQRHNLDKNIIIYACLALGSGCFVLVRTLTVATCGFNASKRLFERMLSCLMHAPMVWFDINPTGRILNRFSEDQNKVDTEASMAFGSVFAVLFSFCGNLITVMVITRYLGIIVIPVGYMYYLLMQSYLNASRELMRLQAMALSPVLTYMSQTVDGITVIRSFGHEAVERCVLYNESLINNYSKVTYNANSARNWFTQRIQLIGSLILLVTAILLFLGSSFISPGMVALSLSYGLLVSSDVMSLVDVWAWFENTMVCPERVLQYSDIPSEGTELQKALFASDATGTYLNDDPGSDRTHLLERPALCSVPPASKMIIEPNRSLWPRAGVVEFQNVWFKYRPEGEIILRDVSFRTKPAEKIGVVGRTGAGKSSIAMCLFRIAELHHGKVIIDGIDVSSISLNCLRSSIAIIPQSPVLFKGPLRNYLDPFREYSDKEIWEALGKGQMAETVYRLGDGTNGSGLSLELAENGDNLSVGQRQMLVLCRALLRDAKILLMDEATASMDNSTDAALQKIIREEFREATVITIAHRIDTIMDCDRVMVLSHGKIVEFDDPRVLVTREEGEFKNFAREAGIIS